MAYPLFHPEGPRDLPMTLSPDEFAEYFPGEGDHVEFKQGIPETKIKEAVAAFSNSDGGVVFLGVADDGALVGVATDGEALARIHRVVAGVRNPGRYDIRPLLVGSVAVLVLSVARRREGFAQMQDGRILVRRGAMNAAPFDTELTRFITERSLARFESAPTSATADHIDPALLSDLADVSGWKEATPERLYEAGLVAQPSAGSSLTVAGALYLTERPADALGKAYIEVFRYRDESDIYDRRTEYAGPLPAQVESATRALVDELGADVVVLGLRRHELPRIPEPVLREAIANAVAHRTYEVTGQAVRIDIRPDRVVVRSPGGLPEPVTVANMRDQNAARNVHVIKMLRRFHLAEDAGRGVDVMQDTMEAALLEPPEFLADESRVEVVLRLGSAVTPHERAWIAEVERRGEIRSQDRVILLHAARGESLNNTAVRELLGVDSVHARAALRRLRDLGYLTQLGTRGGASYVLSGDLGPPAGLRLSDADLREIVLEMAGGGAVTNEAVRERTGMERAPVLALLTAMVEVGLLERRGSRRGTHYLLADSLQMDAPEEPEPF